MIALNAQGLTIVLAALITFLILDLVSMVFLVRRAERNAYRDGYQDGIRGVSDAEESTPGRHSADRPTELIPAVDAQEPPLLAPDDSWPKQRLQAVATNTPWCADIAWPGTELSTAERAEIADDVEFERTADAQGAQR